MKMRIIAAVLTLLTTVAQAEIREADSLTPIEQEIDKCSKGTLILLDLGNTLMIHKDAVLDTKHEDWKRAWFKKHYPNAKREDFIESVRIVESAIDNWELVDNNWPNVITKMQEAGAKVVALTKVVVDPSLKGLRSNNLKKLGIPIKDDLHGLISGTSYLYGDGIIETEAKFKGLVFEEFLPKLSARPSQVIFVDDRIEQIQSVESACLKAGIPCIAFHFTASQKIPRILDEKVADFQLHTLMTEHKWISEEEARDLLSKKIAK